LEAEWRWIPVSKKCASIASGAWEVVGRKYVTLVEIKVAACLLQAVGYKGWKIDGYTLDLLKCGRIVLYGMACGLPMVL
jgi:hypothetical protein